MMSSSASSRLLRAWRASSRNRHVLEAALKAPKDDVEEKNLYQEEVNLSKMYRLTYFEIMMCCTDGLSFACMDDGRSVDFMDGDAHLVWKNLSNMFEPKHRTSMVFRHTHKLLHFTKLHFKVVFLNLYFKMAF